MIWLPNVETPGQPSSWACSNCFDNISTNDNPNDDLLPCGACGELNTEFTAYGEKPSEPP